MTGINGSSARDGGIVERTREEARYFWSDAVDIRKDLQDLAGLEVELLQAEVKEQVGFLQRTAMFGVAAGILALLMLAFAFVALMYGLAEFMETWTAALITTGVIGLLMSLFGLLAYQHARKLSVTPTRTMNTLKEDAQWAKDLVISNKR